MEQMLLGIILLLPLFALKKNQEKMLSVMKSAGQHLFSIIAPFWTTEAINNAPFEVKRKPQESTDRAERSS